jgi:hypothetical protein
MITEQEYNKNRTMYNNLLLGWMYAQNYEVEDQGFNYLWTWGNCRVFRTIAIGKAEYYEYLRYSVTKFGDTTICTGYNAFVKVAKLLGYDY